jgi:receptor protein-tyrosine kinase
MLIRLLFIARRRWLILVLVPLIACTAGALFQPRGNAAADTHYSASGFVGVTGSLNNFQVDQALVSLRQGSLHAKAVAKMSPPARSATISAKLDETTLIAKITVQADTAAAAAEAAKAYTTTFVDEGNGARAKAKVERVRLAQANLETATRALDAFLATNQQALAATPQPAGLVAQQGTLTSAVTAANTALQEASSTTETDGDAYQLINVSRATKDVQSKLQLPASTPIRVIIGLLMGVVGAVALVAFLEKLNPRIDDPAAAERIVGAPVWAMVPVLNRRHNKTIRRVDPETFTGPFAEAFRALRSYIDFRAVADDRTSPARIIVVSASPGEGKSTTAGFLAYSYAEVGRNVVLVGGDLRRPTVHNLFEVERVPGLTSLQNLTGELPPLAEIVKRDPLTNVSVIPSGPSVDRVTGLLDQLRSITTAAQRAECPVIVDSAPVMVANDPIDFLPAVDWVVVVVRMGRSTERSVKRTISALRLADAQIVGCVMIGSMESSDAKRYYYNYYSPEDRKAAAKAEEAEKAGATSAAERAAMRASEDAPVA